MMITATIFTILKVAGLVFLSLLALIVLLLVLVLAVPVRYGIRGTYDKKPEGRAVVSWLFHLLSCRVSYDRELTVLVRVLGFPIYVMGGKKKKLEKSQDIRKEALPGTASENAASGNAASGNAASGEGKIPPAHRPGGSGDGQPQAAGKPGETVQLSDGVSGAESQSEKDAGTEERPSEEQPSEEKSPEEEPSGNRHGRRKKSAGSRKKKQKQKQKRKPGFSFSGFCDTLKKKADRIRGKLQDIRARIRELLEKKDQLAAFLKDKGNQAAFLLVKNKLIAVLKHIFPGTYKGRIRFGFEDPYKTGQILTCAAPFYGIYAGKLELVPVFEEEVLEGELEVRGRVCLGYLLFVGIQILLDRNFRMLLKRLKQMRG